MNDNRIIELLTGIKESLVRQFQSLEVKIDALAVRFDDQAARMDRHGGLL